MAFSYLLIFVYSVTFAAASRHQLVSEPTTNWGTWGTMERCQGSSVVHAFQLKREGKQGGGSFGKYDDTALNGIKLFCGDPYAAGTQVITGSVGGWGEWGAIYSCYPGVLTGYQLRVEPYQSGGDNTATNNVRFFCNRDSRTPHAYIEGDGMHWGHWTDSKHCHANQAICGIQTQVEPFQGNRPGWDDDTSLNRISIECCDYQSANKQVHCKC